MLYIISNSIISYLGKFPPIIIEKYFYLSEIISFYRVQIATERYTGVGVLGMIVRTHVVYRV